MFGCCGCELTLLSDHFIGNFFLHKNELFLTVDIENDACVPPGLSVNFLIAILKRFLVILSIFSDCL